MKATTSITIDVNVLAESKTQFKNFSNTVEDLLRAALKMEESGELTETSLKTKLSALKATMTNTERKLNNIEVAKKKEASRWREI